jgi:hypothetical protein
MTTKKEFLLSKGNEKMASTGTIDYIDSTNTKKQGYYKDGVTYTDDTYNTEIPVGSMVDTAGGVYQKTSSGSVKIGESGDLTKYLNNTDYSGSSSSGSGDYSSYINEMYEAKQDAALAALEAAYDKNVAELDAQEDEIPATYQSARNQTAASSEQSKHNFAEYAAANGLNSGAGGQAELSRSVALQGSLSSLNQAQADALSDLSLQRTQLERDYNSAIATAKADGDYELASTLYQEKVRRQEAATAERQYQDSRALQLASYIDQKAQDALARQDTEYNRNLQIAQLLAQYGDFSHELRNNHD